MDLQVIVTGTLKIPWIAGTRPRSLTRAVIQKCHFAPLVQEIKAKSLSVRFLGILLYGFCILIVKLHEYVEDELARVLKEGTETPQRCRTSDISAVSAGNMLKSSLRYSGGRLSTIPVTPPSLEKLRKELKLEVGDINLAEYKARNEEFKRESFGAGEFMDSNVFQDSIQVDLHLENPLELATPRVSLQMGLSEPTTSKKKRKPQGIDEKIVCKAVKKGICRNYQEMCGKICGSSLEFPEEMREMLEFFRDIDSEELYKIAQDTQIEKAVMSDVKNRDEEMGGQGVRQGSLDVQVEFEFEATAEPQRNFTPVKSVQTVAFEEILREELRSSRSCAFSELVSGYSRSAAAKAFCSLLVLAKTSEIKVTQRKMFEEIKISKW